MRRSGMIASVMGTVFATFLAPALCRPAQAQKFEPSSVLWVSVTKKDFSGAVAAIGDGANVNYKNSMTSNYAAEGVPVLTMACLNDNAPLVSLLLKHGADPNLRDNNGYAPISSAKSQPVLKSLLDAGADANAVGLNRVTALEGFAGAGRADCVDLLLKNHANIDSQDDSGATPLLIAACNRQIDMVKHLVARGANLYATTNDHENALRVASQTDNNLPMIHYLLQHGFEINMKDRDGETPLRVALNFGCIEDMKFLLAHGADVHTRGKNGKTLIDAVYDNDGNNSGLVKNGKAIIALLKTAGLKN